jgi:hypothetical protein
VVCLRLPGHNSCNAQIEMQNIPIPVLFPIPTDEDDFEDLCVDILRIYWNRPGLERYGSRGQRQNGVDIFDLGGVNPLHAAQCKLREFGKKLSPTTIEEEVTDALGFEFSIGKYGILTTAKVTTQAQKKVLEINRRHREAGLFEVELLTWGKLCRLIQTYDNVRKAYFELTVITVDSRIGSKSPIVEEQFREASVVNMALNLTSAIDEARDAITKWDFQVGLLLLNRIRQREDFGAASDHDKFRISSNLGAAELGLGRPDAAADHFLDAFNFAPTILKRQLVHVGAFNLSLILRKLLGAGTPRQWKNRLGRLVSTLYLLFTCRINQKRLCRSRISASVANCFARSRTRLRRPTCRKFATCTPGC